MQQERWGSSAGWPSLLRSKQVAWILQLNPTHVEEMMRDGVLPVVEIDGSRRVPRRQLLRGSTRSASDRSVEKGEPRRGRSNDKKNRRDRIHATPWGEGDPVVDR